MDGGDHPILGNGGARWNPTKEQIDMLEGLYKQGLRTPSAEQIQQITSRLKEFGHIQGKNVFYWFQNHKARQRQKQKQENSALLNRLFHSNTPAAAAAFPPYHNVVCSPCYIQPTTQSGIPSAGCFKRRLISEVGMEKNKQQTSQVLRRNATTQELLQQYNNKHQETLDLFPMHPTGILQAKYQNQTFNPTTSNYENEADNNNSDQPFFDFFCGK